MDTDSGWYQDDAALVNSLKRTQPTRARRPSLAGYDVLTELRRGGQGVVYLAKQQSTKRLVAIKLLREPGPPDDAVRRRFEREVELVAGLQHPRIVTVHDSGRTEDDQPFLVMEFIDGRPLDELILDSGAWSLNSGQDRRRPRDGARDGQQSKIQNPKSKIAAALELFVRICDAIAYAHQRGVIHRDLKPANILVDAQGEPHVLDFGVARLATVAPGSPPVTAGGEFLGTLAYAAPEQITSGAAAADTRSDVYALGVILYLLLTGQHPHAGAASTADLVRCILDQTPQRPSVVGRRAADGGRRNGVDDDLDTIVLKAMAREPQRRYASVDALRRDVEHYLAGEAIEAKRDSARYVLGKLVRRHKAVALLSAIFVVAIAALAVGMTVLYRRTAVQAETSREIRNFLEDTLASVRPAEPGGDVAVREVLDEAVHWVELTLADRPEVEAAIRHTLANSYRVLGKLDQAERQVQLALSLRRAHFGETSVEFAQSLGVLGLLQRDRGDAEAALRAFQDSLAIRRELLGENHPDVALALHNLASAHEACGQPKAAEQALRDAATIHARTRGDRHPDTAMSHFLLAELMARQGRLFEAERLHRLAVDARRAVLPPDHPDVERSLLALGRLLTRAGRPMEAQPLLQECAQLRQDRLIATHPLVREALDALAQSSVERDPP